MSFMGYDNWNDYLMDHPEAESYYHKLRQRGELNPVSARYTINKLRQYRKEKNMARTATIKKRENAPDFVFGSFGYKLDDLKEYVNDKGYINFDILAGKEGGYYVKVSDYGIKSVTKNDTQGEVLEFDEISF